MDVLVAPWAHPARLWKAWCYVASGLVTGIVCFVVVVVLLALAFGLMPVFLLGLPVLWVFFGVVRALSALERSRARALLGRQITEALPPLTKPTKLGRLGERLRSGRR